MADRADPASINGKHDARITHQDAFLAAVAHDLKSPLTIIKALAQWLQLRAAGPDEIDIEHLLRGLRQIDLTASKMSAALNELLDITMIETGLALDLSPQPVDLVQLAREVVAESERYARGHCITVETDLGELIGLWDRFRLERLLTNLVSNALKYSPPETEVRVGVTRLDEAGDRVAALVTVRDQGLGIPEGDLPYIFQRFHRARNVERIPGTGVGLASARQIVEQHGGTIAVESREGEGATFTVRLPLLMVTERTAQSR